MFRSIGDSSALAAPSAAHFLAPIGSFDPTFKTKSQFLARFAIGTLEPACLALEQPRLESPGGPPSSIRVEFGTLGIVTLNVPIFEP